MSGLSAREKSGCRRLLELLDSPDLFSVAETVTNRLIHVCSREEAIDAILTYSQSATELLKRRKVHRDAIFKYLAAENITVPPSSDKHQLLERAIDYWTGTRFLQAEPRVLQARPSIQQVEPRVLQARPSIQQTSPQKTVKEEKPQPESLDYKLLGEKFCEWFYTLLNSQNPICGQEKGDWGPEHFWANAVLRFAYKADQQAVEQYNGAQMSSLRLLALTREERLMFNPNLDAAGLKCTSSPHGLVVVAVAGTIHRGDAFLGVFEQIFGLVRCPLSKTWKIKHVDLKIVGQNSLGSEQTKCVPTVSYQTSELQVYYPAPTNGDVIPR